MKLATTLGLCFTATLLAIPTLHAAEDPTIGPGPAPGLEIFDDAAPVRQNMRETWDQWANPARTAGDSTQPAPGSPETSTATPGDGGTSRARREGIREDLFSDPTMAPPTSQPPYRAPDLRRSVSRARQEDERAATEQQPMDNGYVDPYGDPFAGLDEDMPMESRPPIEQYYDDAPGDLGAGMMDEQYFPPDPVASLMQRLNVRNAYFPGLDQAVAHRDVNGAGGIVLQTLRQRRVVDATMARGVRGSVGVVSPYDVERLTRVINQNPQGMEDPLAPAYRINTILDSLEQPMIEAPDFGTIMPQLLVRLENDIYAVRYAMSEYQYEDEGVYLELARTYIRAATTCDYFDFPRRQLALDVKAIMSKSGTMFYPDGSSRGGDTGGVTGNLFQIMLMMDYYSRNDGWFRRDIRSIWKTLEKPGRFLLDIARPDGTLPMFGPRGTRELSFEEVAAIDSIVPKSTPAIQRIGLAASNSFPHASNVETYSGVYVSRDVKDPRGRYLAVRFGPRGDLMDVPSHNDFGSLELMSRGTRYLTDAGGYGGASAEAPAHGTLSLNRKYVINATYNQPGEPADAVWRTNASIDFALDQAGFEDTKSWQRGVLYVKNLPGETKTDYWVVMDHVNTRDDPEEQELLVRYQLAPGVNAYRDGPGVMVSGVGGGTGLRMFAVDAGARIDVTDGAFGEVGRGQVFDAAGGSMPAPSVVVGRRLSGDATTTTVLYPADDPSHRPLRIERDSDIIRGRTGLLMIDHGMGRVDVVAWAPPGTELVTPTVNLQLSADLAVFRIRRGKIARVDFVNMERFQAKEPDGGLWSMRVDGPAQSLTLEPEFGGGWQVLSDPANKGSASFYDVNLGPTITRRKFSIRPGEMRVIFR